MLAKAGIPSEVESLAATSASRYLERYLAAVDSQVSDATEIALNSVDSWQAALKKLGLAEND
jgi:hypothetical protein